MYNAFHATPVQGKNITSRKTYTCCLAQNVIKECRVIGKVLTGCTTAILLKY